MSEKKPFTITIPRNDTGEYESYDTNLAVAAIDYDDATLRIIAIDGTNSVAIAAAILTLRKIDNLLRKEYPEVVCLLPDADVKEAHTNGD